MVIKCAAAPPLFVLEPQKQLGRGLSSPVVTRTLLRGTVTHHLS